MEQQQQRAPQRDLRLQHLGHRGALRKSGRRGA